jgi:hypothetical protein
MRKEHSSDDAKQTIENVPYSQEEAQVEHIIITHVLEQLHKKCSSECALQNEN